jgi:catechol 2,3-dioxygenase-like lactoylglutathione lyase family enzyme
MLANYPVAAMLRAGNIERAKRFYTETLGLSLAMEQGVAFVVEAGGGTQIAVYQRENMPVPQNNVAVWQVDDVPAIAKDLIARGVQPERYDIPDVSFDEMGVAVLGGRATLWFKDSEDNIHMVSQPLI